MAKGRLISTFSAQFVPARGSAIGYNVTRVGGPAAFALHGFIRALTQRFHRAGSPLAAQATAAASASSDFAKLDEFVCDRGAFGTIDIVAPPAAFASLGRHVARRAEQAGRPSTLSASACAEPWRRLGGTSDASADNNPAVVAQRIADSGRGHVVVVAVTQSTAWGRAVDTAVARLAAEADRAMLLVVLRCEGDGALSGSTSASHRPAAGSLRSMHSAAESPQARHALHVTMHIDRLAGGDALRWWDAVVAQDPFLGAPCFEQLERLDGWWESTRSRSIPLNVELELRDDEQRLLQLALLAQEPLTRGHWTAMAGEACRNLENKGLLLGEVIPTAGIPADALLQPRDGLSIDRGGHEIPAADVHRVAQALADVGRDSWAWMRSAELFAQADDLQRAEELADRALDAAIDTSAREDLWRRWLTVLDDSSPGGGDRQARLERLLRSAEHALTLGDSERADEMARHALGLAGERFDVLLVRGRACAARGDLTTASLSLIRAMACADHANDRSRAAAVLAEVRYGSGDKAEAERYAQQAIDETGQAVTRLAARNVLGKLLIANESWADAEVHFAADAHEAAQHGLGEAELRARLNRGIAMLSSGRREDARRMYEEVRQDGERLNHHRAIAFAVTNLATIAMLDHDYAAALDLTDEAITRHRKLGDRTTPMRHITNLAELRLQLGLYDEAEQALRFGVQWCGGAMPLSQYAYFAKAAASIWLERGNTVEASKELSAARSAAASSDGMAVLSQCERIATRIALEEGDVERARACLVSASNYKHTRFGQAELAVLQAMTARAGGDPFLAKARQALEAARRADAPESVRDAYVLLHHAQRLEGEDVAARCSLSQALEVRERVLASLPEPMRSRYLAKRGLKELANLELELDELTNSPEAATGRRTPVAADAPWGNWTPAQTAAQPSGEGRKLVGESQVMRALRGTVRRIAKTHATVLIHGPTGTGKELVAEAVHNASGRAAGPLVKVNCAALVETLLLSELFGHEKGAFTGASSRRRGRFEVAEGGTLFLDEIGDISPRTQVALLRVLQESTFERVGGCTQLKANVRIVCATHRDLRALVASGDFREDLYYRLAGVVLEVPALKDRPSDVPALANALLTRAVETTGVEARPLADGALRGLARHPWPGNVRELENAVRVAALFARGEAIELDDFTDNVESLRYLADLEPTSMRDSMAGRDSMHDAPGSGVGSTGVGSMRPAALGTEAFGPISTAPASSGSLSLPPPSDSTDLVYAEIRGGTKLAEMKKKLERECIARALVEAHGNITKAASLLGMKRPRLSQLVKQYQLVSVLEDIKS